MKEHKIIFLIRYAPTFIVCALSATLFSLHVYSSIKSANHEISSAQEQMVKSKRAYVQSKVDYADRQLEFIAEEAMNNLTQDIRLNGSRAWRIVNDLYMSNPDLSEKDFTRLVQASLRNYRFNNDRGYIFIYKMDGTTILHPLLPEMEGLSMWDYQDSRGSYVIRDLARLAKNRQEDLHRWWFFKPGIEKTDFEKVGYTRVFKPYNWFIGTGDYIADVQREMQLNALSWLNQYYSESLSNFYVVTGNGEVLVHSDPKYKGKNIDEITEVRLVENLLPEIEGSESYITHSSPSDIDVLFESYVKKNAQWGWVIGGSYDLTEMNHQLEQRRAELRLDRNKKLASLFLTYSLGVCIIAWISLVVSRKVTLAFEQYQRELKGEINKLSQSNSSLEYLANHDQLTDLFNRHWFNLYIDKALDKAKVRDDRLLVCFIDVDDFKYINDYYGHSVGDELLIQIGRMLKEVSPVSSEVFRFGGDEFIVTFPYLSDSKQAESVMEAFHNQLVTEYHCFEHKFNINFSLGGATYPDHGHTVDELLAKSDIMLHSVKSEGKADCALFESDILEKNQRKFQISEQLLSAIDHREIYLVYQPQYCLKSCTLRGVEALARWKNPILGTVYPDEFISIAESSGHIFSLGWYLIELAFQEYSEVDLLQDDSIQLALNISPAQLEDKGFVERLAKTAKHYAIDPAQVCLEATEGIMLKQPEEVIKIAYQLRSLGFVLSVDDFGTGYSSLTYLSSLPLNELKIDRSFIGQISDSKNAQELLKSIVAIGRATGMRTVAEGVETIEQLECLKRYGCDLVQGYLFSRPVALEEATRIRTFTFESMDKSDVTAIHSDAVPMEMS